MNINQTFRVDSLDEITKEHFTLAAIAAMAEEEELKGMLGVPCSNSEYLLYAGPGESWVQLRNWSHMLSLHIVSKSGRWLVSSHIEGMTPEGVINEAYRQFQVAKPYIKKDCKRAFSDMELAEGSKGRWLEGLEMYMQQIREYMEGQEV